MNTDESQETKSSPSSDPPSTGPSKPRPYHKGKVFIDPGETPLAGILYQMYANTESPTARPVLKRAYEFINELHCPLVSKADFRRAKAGLMTCRSLVPEEHGKRVMDLYQMVRQSEADAREMNQVWFQEDVQEIWGQLLLILEKSLPKDVLQDCRQLMASVFDGDPPS